MVPASSDIIIIVVKGEVQGCIPHTKLFSLRISISLLCNIGLNIVFFRGYHYPSSTEMLSARQIR